VISDVRSTYGLIALALSALAVGGCPMALDVPTIAPTPTVTAGTYWVADVEGDLAYYELPATRDASGRWVNLTPADQTWYAGPGWYTTGGHDDWTAAVDMGSITLDDVVTLHDPAPVPDASD